MTRINIIPPQYLTDQHLIAEIKEINQLSGQFLKSINSRLGIKQIPQEFKLGTGHVTFFYNKGEYLLQRFSICKEEAEKRDFCINSTFNNTWANHQEYFLNWQPNNQDFKIIIERLIIKLNMKPLYYRLNRKTLKFDDYIESLNNIIK